MIFLTPLLFTLLGYTFDPMEPARKDINFLKEHHKDWIKSYEAPHRKMSYTESGDASKRPVVFVHGSPGTKEAWYSFHLDPDLQKNFHLLSVDRPGYGKSQPGKTERSVEIQAQDIWEVLKNNTSKKTPILVSHSYGGAVIARMGADHPEDVHALLFVASSVDPSLEETKFIQYIGNLWIIRSLIPDDLRVCNEEILALKNSLEEIKWEKIKCGVGIIHGTKDDLVPYANVDFIKQHIPANQMKLIITLDGMNHFIPWHRPHSIKEALLKLDAP